MDKEKLKKYTGYAGLGILGGYISFVLVGGLAAGEWDPIGVLNIIFTPFLILILILWGLIGGIIANKWWGALVGGFISSWLFVLFLLWFWGLSS